jgi:hypothetical protein
MIQIFDSMTELLESVPKENMTFEMCNAFVKAYEEAFGIVHSDCYCKYGLDRTGCACCPFGKFFERELAVAEQFEPNLYRAAIHVFGKSYEYTRQYREFQKKMEGGAE